MSELPDGIDFDHFMRLVEIRHVVMGNASTRASAESVVTAILEGIVDADDDEPAPTIEGHDPEMTVGELRARLRRTLEEIAEHETGEERRP